MGLLLFSIEKENYMELLNELIKQYFLLVLNC